MAKFKIVDDAGTITLNIQLPDSDPRTRKVLEAFSKTVEIYTKKSHKVIPLRFVKDELLDAMLNSSAPDMALAVEPLDGESYFIGSEYL